MRIDEKESSSHFQPAKFLFFFDLRKKSSLIFWYYKIKPYF